MRFAIVLILISGAAWAEPQATTTQSPPIQATVTQAATATTTTTPNTPMNEPPAVAANPTEARQHAEIEKKIDELTREQKKLSDSESRFDFLGSLLGLASFALLIFSLVLAVVAFFGWKHLEDLQERRVSEAVKTVDRITSARVRASVGFILGRMARDEGNFLTAQRSDLVEASIGFLQPALAELTAANSEYQWNAMNNLAFNYAISGNRMYAPNAIQLVQKLKKRALETGKNPEFLTTYVRVVGEFLDLAAEPQVAYRDIVDILEAIQTSGKSRITEVREAEQYKHWLRSRYGEI